MRAIKIIALSLIITVVISTAAFFTRGIAPGLWEIIGGWGIYSYIIIIFSLWSLLDSISNDWKFNRLGLLPGFIGILGFICGLARECSQTAEVMSGASELFTYHALVTGAAYRISAYCDFMLFGVGLSLLLFTLSTCVRSYRSPIKE